MSALPEPAYATALASLPRMTTGRLRWLVELGACAETWARIVDRTLPQPPADDGEDDRGRRAAWRDAARAVDVAELWRRTGKLRISVAVIGRDGYPGRLAFDADPPAVLFHRGDVELLDGPLVSIVGTRRCTHYGRDIAGELGRELASEGVGVVSGLALGIDAAAHEGALAGGGKPVAVVGSGADVVYPRRNRELWSRVVAEGLLLTEAPPGARAEPWRFPLRNRIIAALADVVVVVESHARGGSMYTVDEASKRDVAILAVPGSVHSSASAGSNALLRDLAVPALDVTDVLVALGFETAGARHRRRGERRRKPDHDDEPVLAAVGWEPTSLETILLRTGLQPGRAALALDRLEDAGWVRATQGWWERRA